MVKILHLVYDEKFIDFIADVFGASEGAVSQFRVIVDDVCAPLKRVRNVPEMQRVDHAYASSRRAEDDLAWCNALIIHYLGLPAARVINRAPRGVTVAWSAWGGDLHELLPAGGSELIAPRTRRLLDQLGPTPDDRSVVGRARALIRPVRRRLVVDRILRRAIRRVDVFSAPVPGDYDVLQRALPGLVHAEYAQLNYVSVERTLSRGLRAVTGDDILVGNSASATNNHADVFDQLAGLELGSRKVLVPLSYGDTRYRDAVIAYGRQALGACLEPIVDFMPLERYNELISRCSIAVMGHRRQEAVGNIATLMQAGARVFIDRASPVFSDLSARGAVISGLDGLTTDGSSCLVPLTDDQRNTNRNVLRSVWGHDVVMGNTQRFIDRLSMREAAHCA
jgi:dTDP-N-acetylfucosamine:lipid II N-acetylfucosaminyltransferase